MLERISNISLDADLKNRKKEDTQTLREVYIQDHPLILRITTQFHFLLHQNIYPKQIGYLRSLISLPKIKLL